MNRERLETALAAAEREDGGVGFDVGYWGAETTCGTTLCLAGWAALHAGDPPDLARGTRVVGQVSTVSDALVTRITDLTVTGRRVYDVASAWLELTDDEDWVFYSGAETVAELRAELADWDANVGAFRGLQRLVAEAEAEAEEDARL